MAKDFEVQIKMTAPPTEPEHLARLKELENKSDVYFAFPDVASVGVGGVIEAGSGILTVAESSSVPQDEFTAPFEEFQLEQNALHRWIEFSDGSAIALENYGNQGGTAWGVYFVYPDHSIAQLFYAFRPHTWDNPVYVDWYDFEHIFSVDVEITEINDVEYNHIVIPMMGYEGGRRIDVRWLYHNSAAALKKHDDNVEAHRVIQEDFAGRYARTPANITATSTNTTPSVSNATHTHALADNAVTNVKLANMNAGTLKGFGGPTQSGVPTDLTAAQVIDMLGIGAMAFPDISSGQIGGRAFPFHYNAGNQPPQGWNLNNFTQPGIYTLYPAANATPANNWPSRWDAIETTPPVSGGTLIVLPIGTTTLSQVLLSTVYPERFFIRSFYPIPASPGTVWSGWETVITRSSLARWTTVAVTREAAGAGGTLTVRYNEMTSQLEVYLNAVPLAGVVNGSDIAKFTPPKTITPNRTNRFMTDIDIGSGATMIRKPINIDVMPGGAIRAWLVDGVANASTLITGALYGQGIINI